MVTPYKYLIKNIEKKQKQLEYIIEKRFGKYMYPEITITYDLDRANALGTCRSTFMDDSYYHTISLNPELLNELKDRYINLVFVHEYAHAVVRDHFVNSKPHGKEFKHICSLFGISGKSTTDIAANSNILKTHPKKQKRIAYSCGCGYDHQVSTRMHNSILSGRARLCGKCKTRIFEISSKKQQIA